MKYFINYLLLIPFFILFFLPGIVSATVPTAAWNVTNDGTGHVVELTGTYASGTIIGSPSATTGPGGNGAALHFTGGMAVDLAHNFNFGSSDFTIAVWEKTTATASAVIWGEYNGSGGHNMFCNPSGGGIQCAAVGSGAIGNFLATGANDGNWHLLGLIRRGTSMVLSVDGVDSAPQTIGAGDTFAPVGDLFLNQFGSFGSQSGVNNIYEAGVWMGTGLSAVEMAGKYNNPGTLWNVALSPGTISLSSKTNTTINLSSTAATGGTAPYTYQWYRSTSSGFTPGVGNILSGQTSLTLNDTGLTAATTYYYKIRATDSGSLTADSAEFSVTTSSVTTVAVNNPALQAGLSPYNWYVSGSSYIQAINPGAYFKVNFSGTSVSLGVDVSAMSGASVAAKRYPRITYQIDGGAWQTYQLLSTDTQISLGSSLANTTHSLQVVLLSSDGGTPRWNGTMSLKITNLTIDQGSSLSTATLLSKRMLIFGDSITEGAWVLGSSVDASNYSLYGSATSSYAVPVAGFLNAEYGNASFGGQGWVAAPGGGTDVPNFPSAWNYILGTNSRLVGGLFSPAPDYILVNLGTNDSAFSSSVVSTWLSAARVAAGSAAKIFVLIPFKQTNSATITTGFNSYKSGSGDANAFLIDLDGNGTTYADTNPTYSYDGTHPNAAGDAQLGTLVSSAILSDIATISASPSSIVKGSTGNVITLTGANTLWTAGNPGSPTFTISGGSGASITAQTVANSNSATLTVTAGNSTGTLIVTDPLTSATTTVSVINSSDATLSGLTINSGTLSPSFDSNVISYTDSVTNDITSVTVTPTKNQSNATIKVNGTVVASGSSSSPIVLNSGSNTITVAVTAQDGTTIKTYTITVNVSAPIITPTPTISPGGGGGSPSMYGVVENNNGTNSKDTTGMSNTALSLSNKISSLQIQLAVAVAEMNNITPALSFVFTRNLHYGMTGNDIQKLQEFLVSQNSGPATKKLATLNATMYFATLTQNALIEFQNKVGIKPASGNFGPITRAYINSLVK